MKYPAAKAGFFIHTVAVSRDGFCLRDYSFSEFSER